MSYIRCLNNPDGAYVWCAEKEVSITSAELKTKAVLIPTREFHGLVACFVRYPWLEKWKLKDFKMWESEDFHYYCFDYKGQTFKLWQVTWEYIVNNAKDRKK